MSPMPRCKPLAVLLMSLVLVTAVGCGGTGTVSGEVKVNGKPVPDGIISFFVKTARKNKSPSGAIENGKYTVIGVPVGEAVITVQGVAKPPPPPDPKEKKPIKPKKPDLPEPPLFHSKYADAKTSGLTYTVTSGNQEHDINLDPPPEEPKKKKGK